MQQPGVTRFGRECHDNFVKPSFGGSNLAMTDGTDHAKGPRRCISTICTPASDFPAAIIASTPSRSKTRPSIRSAALPSRRRGGPAVDVGGLVASGWHTGAISMRLMVEAVPIAGGLIGASGEIRWTRPVRPGDTLHVECEIIEVRPSRSQPGRGMATIRSETRNQSGEVVEILVARLVVPPAVSKRH